MELNKRKKIRGVILNAFTCLFAVLSIVLGFMIYAKKDENAAFLRENFNVNVDFTEFNENVSRTIDSLFSFGFINKEKTTPVNSTITYIPLGDNLYKSQDNQIMMLDNGIVLGTYKEKDNSYSVIVSYDNGVIASYSGLDRLNVKTYDKLKKSNNIGTYESTFKVLFKKNGKLISINEIK